MICCWSIISVCTSDPWLSCCLIKVWCFLANVMPSIESVGTEAVAIVPVWGIAILVNLRFTMVVMLFVVVFNMGKRVNT